MGGISWRKTPDTGDVSAPSLPPSAVPYSGFALRLYDLFVLRFTSPYAWGCHRRILTELYQTHSTPTHAEVGVGSGYFLRQLTPTWETVALIDPNRAALSYVSRRLGTDKAEQHEANILVERGLPQRRFSSVAANYLLHCLPGPMETKETAVSNLARLTAKDGTLFGATVIGRSADHNRLGRIVMWLCNRTGTFGNTDDTDEELRRILEQHFSTVVLRRENRVALFVASKPRQYGGRGCTASSEQSRDADGPTEETKGNRQIQPVSGTL